jgi:hypothetical protein
MNRANAPGLCSAVRLARQCHRRRYAQKGNIASAAGPAESPRLDVVFHLWQWDKENHGWREGPPVTGLFQSFRSAGRAFTLRHNQIQTKEK